MAVGSLGFVSLQGKRCVATGEGARCKICLRLSAENVNKIVKSISAHKGTPLALRTVYGSLSRYPRQASKNKAQKCLGFVGA